MKHRVLLVVVVLALCGAVYQLSLAPAFAGGEGGVLERDLCDQQGPMCNHCNQPCSATAAACHCKYVAFNGCVSCEKG